jgi:hypothetical protein
MSRISNYLIGMEEEGRLIYNESKREYVPAGLAPRSAIHKYRSKRKKIANKKRSR